MLAVLDLDKKKIRIEVDIGQYNRGSSIDGV